VNLRSENYSESSRIPEMTFGTATDDAFRRVGLADFYRGVSCPL